MEMLENFVTQSYAIVLSAQFIWKFSRAGFYRCDTQQRNNILKLLWHTKIQQMFGNPLTSWPLDSVPISVWGKNLLFFPPLAYNDLCTLTGHEKLILMDCICVSVRYQTVPVVSVLTCILLCTVLNCFKLRWIKWENKVFYPQGGCGGQKHFSFRHSCHFGDSCFPRQGGGQENLRNFWILAGGFVVFYFSWCQRSEFLNN